MKIIIMGASVGGLLSAFKLGKLGNEVLVFEKQSQLGYDWYDYVWEDFFEKLGFDDAQKEIRHYRKNNMSFDIHNYDKVIKLNQENREYAISRIDLANFLFKKASLVSTIYFDKEVTSLIIEDGMVRGIVSKNENYYADLVIDNLGLDSPFKLDPIDEKDIMFVFRETFSKNNCETENDTLCYLRHLNDKGISWVNVTDDVDLLIGRINKLTKEEAKIISNSLIEDNKVIGNQLSNNNKIYKIPLRYPALRMFKEGYITLGDSAYMNIPLLGSGIYLSIQAASILEEVIKKGININNLYQYQKRFYLECGLINFESYILKNFLLNSNLDKLLVLIKINVITNNDINNVYYNKGLNYSFKELFKKTLKGFFHPFLLLKMLFLLRRVKKIRKLVLKMPLEYSENSFYSWQNKIKKFLKK